MNKHLLLEKRDNFSFKLSAATYHLKTIDEIFIRNKEALGDDDSSDNPTRPVFYHYNAFVYEICSCFDMTLHYVNKKFDILIEDKSVQWKEDKSRFQKALILQQPAIYTLIGDIYDSEWFKALKATRDYLTHNGVIALQIDFSKDHVNVINPIIGNKIFHFDCNLWGKEISKFFNKIYSE